MAEEKHENLEGKVNSKESKGFIRKVFDLGFNSAMAAGATALGVATAGGLAPLVAGSLASGITFGGFMAKKKSGKSGLDIVNEALKAYSTINTILSPIIWLGDVTYPLVGQIGANMAGGIGSFAAKSLYAVTGYNMAFTASFNAVHHIYDNKFNPTGIGQSIKKDYWPVTKRIAKLFAPGYILTANGVTDLLVGGYKIPVFPPNAFVVGAYNQINPPVPAPKPAAQKKQLSDSEIKPEQVTQYLNQNPQYLQNYLKPLMQAQQQPAAAQA